MKIKIKDEMSKYKITCTHKEIILIQEALKSLLETKEINVEQLNAELFDRDEYESFNQIEVKKDVKDMKKEIKKTLMEVYPF